MTEPMIDEQTATAEPPPLVCVVDDDLSVREALAGLIRAAGWPVEVFGSAHEFLARDESVR